MTRARPASSLAYQLTASTCLPPMSSVSEASAEVEMPCGHQRSVARSSSSQAKAQSTARPISGATKERCGPAVEVRQHGVEPDPTAEQGRQRVDLADVLVGARRCTPTVTTPTYRR